MSELNASDGRWIKNKGNSTLYNNTKLNLKALVNGLYCVLFSGGNI